MNTSLTVAVILFCLQTITALPNGDKDKPVRSSGPFHGNSRFERDGPRRTVTVHSSNDPPGKQTTSTTTITKSSSTHVEGEVEGTSSKKQSIVHGRNDDDCICDCNCCGQHLYTDDDFDYWDGMEITTTSWEVEWLARNCKCESTTVVNIEELTLQLNTAYDEIAQLKTKWIAATADAQRWKSKSDGFEIELKKSVDINAQLTIIKNEYTTTIANLRTTINEITAKNNICGTDSDLWKRKWETENAKVIKSETVVKELEASNVDLKSRIVTLTDDLSSCRKVIQENDSEISKLKITITNLTKQVSDFTVNLGSCNSALKRVTDDLDADKLLDMEAAKRRAKLELELGECTNRKKVIEKDLESERKVVEKCKVDIVNVRDECSKRYQKYDDDITELKLSNKVSIDACEASLNSEKDKIAKIRIEVTNLETRIGDLESKLTVAVKKSDEWQSKIKFCEDDSITLKETIRTLQTNLGDTNKHLSTCVANSNSLQSELTSCKSQLDNCNGNLNDTKKRLTDGEVIIVSQNSRIDSLESAKKVCEMEMAKLRCEVKDYVGGVKLAFDVMANLLDGNKKSLSDFVGSHDLTCSA